MFGRFAIRLGLIAAMALSVYGVGKLANFVLGVGQDSHEVPFQTTELEAPLSDPTMSKALAELQARHGPTSGDLIFQSPSGPVEMSANDVYNLNRRYVQMRWHEKKMSGFVSATEELEREQMKDAGWSSDSF